MKICILIPVYNEKETIGGVVDLLIKKKQDVVVVDDGSTDNSGKIAEDKGAEVLRNDKKQGKGYSLRRGFDHVVAKGYDGVITMDGDGQHEVNDISKFIDGANNDSKCVISGNRMEDYRGMPFLRYLTNRFMSKLISLVCKQAISDTQCGFRYISCDILKNLCLSSKDFEIETEILIKSSKKGYKILSVPIKTIYCNEVSKINPIKETIRFIIYFIKEVFSS